MSSGSSCSHVGSASCPASSKRFNRPSISFRFSLEVPKSFFVRYSICWRKFSFPAGLFPMFFVKTGSFCLCGNRLIQLVDHVLVRKDFWIFWIASHMFSAPFSLLLLYHKKQWKRSRKPSIYKGFQTWYRVRSPSVSVGWHRCFTRSFRRFECLGLFDFKPGHEPVELLPGQLFYFQLISGPAKPALNFHTFIQQRQIRQIPRAKLWSCHNVFHRKDTGHFALDPYGVDPLQ